MFRIFIVILGISLFAIGVFGLWLGVSAGQGVTGTPAGFFVTFVPLSWGESASSPVGGLSSLQSMGMTG